MSHFIRALNSFQETFPGISYTDVYSHNDEIVRPNSDDTGSSSLHGGGGRITNVAVQDICPADSSDHDLLGTIDAVAYALAFDALDHDGPASKGRIDPSVCAQPYQPGVDPATGPAAGLQALYNDESSTGPETTSEPALACYVFASCKLGEAGSQTCAGKARVRFALHHARRERIVAANVYVDGRRVARHRGHKLKSIVIKRPKSGKHTIKLVTRASDGVRRFSVRRMRGCKIGHPRGRRLRRAH